MNGMWNRDVQANGMKSIFIEHPTKACAYSGREGKPVENVDECEREREEKYS